MTTLTKAAIDPTLNNTTPLKENDTMNTPTNTTTEDFDTDISVTKRIANMEALLEGSNQLAQKVIDSLERVHLVQGVTDEMYPPEPLVTASDIELADKIYKEYQV